MTGYTFAGVIACIEWQGHFSIPLMQDLLRRSRPGPQVCRLTDMTGYTFAGVLACVEWQCHFSKAPFASRLYMFQSRLSAEPRPFRL